ncbi:Coiled-coil domain-containing protein 97 [Lobulomyces angularis]|nr:Coiled-coil domain-containing protein 97 [Lobulomyces angularis]
MKFDIHRINTILDETLSTLSNSKNNEFNSNKSNLYAREKVLNMIKSDLYLFLEKFGYYLKKEDLHYFLSLNPGYEVAFTINNLLKNNYVSSKQIKNRRKVFLTKYSDEYFSLEAMKFRYPKLYEEYIGRYIKSSEVEIPFDDSVSLVDRIYQGYDESTYKELLDTGYPVNLEVFEEFDSDEENSVHGNEITLDERKILEVEFIELIHNMFLSGKDTDFDYFTVDNNPNFDDLDKIEMDMEDSYFDSEIPSQSAKQITFAIDNEEFFDY